MRKQLTILVTSLTLALSVVATIQGPASATPDHYVPNAGPAFNNPYGKQSDVRRLIRQVNRSIDSVPRGGKIRISAWNVRSFHLVASLIRAHRRNVSVQVVMDRANWNPNNPNADAARLQAALKEGNKTRPPEMRSFLRRCLSSCRGKFGIPHTKFFLFNKLRTKKDGEIKTVRWVTMFGSYNATELGATIQWNDLYTTKEQPERYRVFESVFNQMKRDKKRAQGLVEYDDGVVYNAFYPYTGDGATGDPVMKLLDQVACTGAATPKGHTRIRIAQTAMYGDRGMVIAKKLARMKKQGCDIRLVYAMFGTQVLEVLRKARIPMTHLAYDSNEDGLYDKYVHMKSMAISGHFAGDPAAKITLNGSANWTSVALASDEVVGIVRRKWVTNRYMEWIDYIFEHRPAVWGVEHPGNKGAGATGRLAMGQPVELTQEEYAASVEARARARGVDPYALIKEEN